MDNTNSRAVQAQAQAQIPLQSIDAAAAGGASENEDWRTQLLPESRQRIVNKIMETLKRHLPFSGPEGLLELEKIAVGVEVKFYAAATSQSDYLRKISLKMLTIETKSQPPMGNATQPNQGNDNQNPGDSGQGMASNMFANTQRQMPGRQLQVGSQQSQNHQQFLYQQQLQLQQQQQQHYGLQQSIMQPTMIHYPPRSNFQQNQQSSNQQATQTMLPQHSEPIRQQQQHLQQESMILPQTSLGQQPVLLSQQQRQPQLHIIGQPPSGTNIQQNQMMSQPNSIEGFDRLKII